MTLELVLELQRTGGQILDTRDPVEFAAAHLAGSFNVGLGGSTPPGPARSSTASGRS